MKNKERRDKRVRQGKKPHKPHDEKELRKMLQAMSKEEFDSLPRSWRSRVQRYRKA